MIRHKGSRILTMFWVTVFVITVFTSGVAVGNLSRKPQSTGNLGYYDGNNLLRLIPAAQIGYITGVFDAFRALQTESIVPADRLPYSTEPEEAHAIITEMWNDAILSAHFTMHNAMAKVPRTVYDSQLRDVVVKYINENPAERHNNAALLVWRALAEAEWR